jgi:outer membrane protein TolC
LTGASSGPARLFVDISPVDIYFEPLAARQSKQAVQAGEVATFNDTLLEVTIAYLELVRSQSQVAIAEEAVKNAKELVGLTEDFARTGAGLEADAARARAELANRRRNVLATGERVQVVSTELARLLRLEQNVTLFAADSQPVPLPMVADETPLEELVAQALSTRPELSQYQALVAETLHRMRQEKWRPWIPNIYLGASGGGFGGGEGSFHGNFDGRSDFDALAVWELRNLGLGNRSLHRERSSQHRQAYLAYTQIQDQIIADVTRAYRQVQSRKGQIEQARIQVKSAATALPLNFNGIRGRELRPIEAQQAIAALATARESYLSSVIDYDRAQFALLRAIGQPPESPVVEAAIHNDQPVLLAPESSVRNSGKL